MLLYLYETKTGQNFDAELKLEDKATQDEGVAGEEVLKQRSLNLVKRSYKTYGRKNGKPYKTQW